jgi:hypothetical protein
MKVRAGSSAEIVPALDKMHMESALSKGASGREASYTCTDNGDGFLCGLDVS